jgi:hypothetical protein
MPALIELSLPGVHELMFVNTATYSDHPDGCLIMDKETKHKIMSAIYGLNWRPSGPQVIETILKWAGFVETHLIWWKKRLGGPGWGRLEIVGSKKGGALKSAIERGRLEPTIRD